MHQGADERNKDQTGLVHQKSHIFIYMKKCLNNVKHELGVHDAKYPYTELTEVSAYWLRIMSRCRNELCRNISKNKFHQHTF